MKNNGNIGLLIMITVGWWGLMYPEYCLSENVVEMVCDITAEESREEISEEELLQNLLRAQPEEIVIKSRLYEYLKENFGKS